MSSVYGTHSHGEICNVTNVIQVKFLGKSLHTWLLSPTGSTQKSELGKVLSAMASCIFCVRFANWGE